MKSTILLIPILLILLIAGATALPSSVIIQISEDHRISLNKNGVAPNTFMLTRKNLVSKDLIEWVLFWKDEFENLSEVRDNYIIYELGNYSLKLWDSDGDGNNDSLLLVEEVNSSGCALFIKRPVDGDELYIRIRFRMWNTTPGIADGFAIAFFKNPFYIPAIGGSLSFQSIDGTNNSGYGVEVDIYRNGFDPGPAHIGIIHNNVENHLAVKNFSSMLELVDNQWHTLEVKVVANSITVFLDDEIVVGCWLPTGIARTFKYVGLTGATGGLTVNVLIDYLEVYVRKHAKFGLLWYDEFNETSINYWKIVKNADINGTGVLPNSFDGKKWLTLIDNDSNIRDAAVASWFVGWNGGCIKYDLIIEAKIRIADVTAANPDREGCVIMFYKNWNYVPAPGEWCGFSPENQDIPGWGIQIDMYGESDLGDPGSHYISVVYGSVNHTQPLPISEIFSWGPDYSLNGTNLEAELPSLDWVSGKPYGLHINEGYGDLTNDALWSSVESNNAGEDIYICVIVDTDPFGRGSIEVYYRTGYPDQELKPWWMRIFLRHAFKIPRLYGGIGFAASTASDYGIGCHVDWVRIWVRDPEPPSVDIEPIYSNRNWVNVTWSASDNVGIDHYEIYLDGKYMGSTVKTFAVLWCDDGEHTVRIVAVDRSGNVNATETKIVVDKRAPTLSIGLENGSYVPSTFVLEWSTNDTDIKEFKVYLDGEPVAATRNTSLELENITAGYHRILVEAVDLAGNKGKDSIIVFVDDEAPEVSLKVMALPLPGGDVLSLEFVRISWEASDNVQIREVLILVDGEVVANFSTPSGSATVRIFGLGKHRVEVLARDIAGNEALARCFAFVLPTYLLIVPLVACVALVVLLRKYGKRIKRALLKPKEAAYARAEARVEEAVPLELAELKTVIKEIEGEEIVEAPAPKEVEAITPPVSLEEALNVLSWSPDSRTLAIAIEDRVFLVDASTGKKLTELSNVTKVTAVDWSPTGELIAIGDDAGGISVWNTDGLALLGAPAHRGKVTVVSWSPNGELLLTASVDGYSKVFETTALLEVQMLEKHKGRAVAIWSPDGSRILTAGEDGIVILWEVNTWKKLASQSFSGCSILAVCWDRTSNYIALGCSDGTVIIVDGELLSEKVRIELKAPIVSLTWMKDSEKVVVGLANGEIAVVDAKAGKKVKSLKCDGEIRSMVISPDGSKVSALTNKGTIEIFSTASWKKEVVFPVL